jgi:Ras GTPase-activating-like protein IQGAP2/3
MSSRRLTNRNTNRYSVNQLYSMAAEQDPDVEDDLSRGKSRLLPDILALVLWTNADSLYYHVAAQKRLRELKSKISAQSKKNFVLERDVRYLDGRIALLIQNRMALDEVSVLVPGDLQTVRVQSEAWESRSFAPFSVLWNFSRSQSHHAGNARREPDSYSLIRLFTLLLDTGCKLTHSAAT